VKPESSSRARKVSTILLKTLYRGNNVILDFTVLRMRAVSMELDFCAYKTLDMEHIDTLCDLKSEYRKIN
jgi:hypothetical protein